MIHERLGESEHASHVRARHQSAQLKSDVQAFKAANPGCVLEDFVRWHSPRDWLPDPTARGGGRLSERMLTPNNLWTVLWGATLPVAASQQRPLFDAAREAQEVLHRLDRTPPSKLLPQLVHLAVEGALASLACSPVLEFCPTAAAKVAELGGAITRLDGRGSAPSQWAEALLGPLAEIEIEMQRAASLSRKLPASPALACALLSDPTLRTEASVPSAQRVYLEKHVHDDDAPDVSEWVLRAAARRPCAPAALPTAQRMYVAQRDDTWRLAIALSVDHDGGE